MQKALAVCSCQMHSPFLLGRGFLSWAVSESIKTQGGQGHIICLVMLWGLWFWWWMFHDLISGESESDHVASGWKENCPGFPGCLPWAIHCKALASAAASYRSALCFSERLFLLPEMCGVKKNSVPLLQNYNGSFHQEVLMAAPASTDWWPLIGGRVGPVTG